MQNHKQKNLVADIIRTRFEELNGTLVIMITDNCVRDETANLPLTPSQQSPRPSSCEALMVAIWGPDGIPTCGMQLYQRCADGKVMFEELEWEEQSTEYRFARGNMANSEDEFGMPVDSKKTQIN